jgi:hypothetical protein
MHVTPASQSCISWRAPKTALPDAGLQAPGLDSYDPGHILRQGGAVLAYPGRLLSWQVTVETKDPHLSAKDREPAFAGYLCLAFTNATAFSPTDTMPLSRWAKLAMTLQSAVSLITAAW